MHLDFLLRMVGQVQLILYVRVVSLVYRRNMLFRNTLVNTDQGKVKFNELTTKNTINKHKIKKVVSVMNKDNTMVLIKKDSLGDSVPNKDTYISNNHKILIDGNYFEAKNIINNINIHKKYMPRKRLYNVLLDHHGKMIVNNMVVETLDPKNKFAQ